MTTLAKLSPMSGGGKHRRKEKKKKGGKKRGKARAYCVVIWRETFAVRGWIRLDADMDDPPLDFLPFSQFSVRIFGLVKGLS